MNLRVCAWSGPRNVSTALMRSFEARGDCEVVDEPLYAAFLAATGKDHPGRDEVLASQPTDPRAVLEALRRPPSAPLRWEKHMAHHWQPGWPFDAIGEARQVLLIRDPARVVASYARIREAPVPEDLGLLQQVELARRWDELGVPVIVVDGDDLLSDPPTVLRRLTDALGVPYTDHMLRWAPGRRATDGVWAPYWYAGIEASTGFEPPRPERRPVPTELAWVVDALRPAYEALASRRGSLRRAGSGGAAPG